MKKPSSQAETHLPVTCTLHEKANCRKELHVVSSKELLSSCRTEALKLLSKAVSIPGFRKGKVPEFIILQKFSKELEEEWKRCVLQKALQSSLAQEKVHPLDPERIEGRVQSFSPEEATCIFSFEVAPIVPHVDPSLFKLKEVQKPVVDEKKVEETLRQVLFFYSNWKPVEGRAIQEGDFVLLDVDILENTPPSSLFKYTRFEVTDGSMAKWMKDLLIGKNAGEVVEGVSVPDEDASEADKASLGPQKVRLTIHKIEAPELPELTPELLKNLGAESEQDLRVKIEKLLEKQAEKHVKEEQKAQVKEFLLSQYPFDLPISLINNEVRFRVNQLNQNQEFLEHWRSLSQEEQKNTIETIKIQSEKAVRLFHLSNQLIQDKKLVPSLQDLPKAAETQLEALLDPESLAASQQDPRLRHAEAMARLTLDEVENYIIAQAISPMVG